MRDETYARYSNRYSWIANSFRAQAWKDSEFIEMLCGLVTSGVPTVIIEGPRGPIVVTWQKPAYA